MFLINGRRIIMPQEYKKKPTDEVYDDDEDYSDFEETEEEESDEDDDY